MKFHTRNPQLPREKYKKGSDILRPYRASNVSSGMLNFLLKLTQIFGKHSHIF